MDFSEGIDRLKEQVGHRKMTGSVAVSQVYAEPQERGAWLNFMGRYGPKNLHPRHGGEIHALENSLSDNSSDYMQKLADGLLRERGLYDAMVDDVEHLSSEYGVRAPIETGALRLSAHPTVTDDDVVVYDRAPVVPRLSAEELADKSRRYEDQGERPAARTAPEPRAPKPVREAPVKVTKTQRRTADRKELQRRVKEAGGLRYGDKAHNDALAQSLGFEDKSALDREFMRLEGAPEKDV